MLKSGLRPWFQRTESGLCQHFRNVRHFSIDWGDLKSNSSQSFDACETHISLLPESLQEYCSEFHSITESLLQFQPSHLDKMRLCELRHTTFGSSNVKFLAAQNSIGSLTDLREEDRESGPAGRGKRSRCISRRRLTALDEFPDSPRLPASITLFQSP